MFRLQVIKKKIIQIQEEQSPIILLRIVWNLPIILQVFNLWFSNIDSNQKIQEQIYKLKKGKGKRWEHGKLNFSSNYQDDICLQT